MTSGQVIFDMLGGDDFLDLHLPSGLDVTVAPSDGNDTTNLRFADGGAPKANLVQVDSERITFDMTSPLVSIADDTVRLTGDVFAGIDGARSQLGIGTGSLQVDRTADSDGRRDGGRSGHRRSGRRGNHGEHARDQLASRSSASSCQRFPSRRCGCVGWPTCRRPCHCFRDQRLDWSGAAIALPATFAFATSPSWSNSIP